MTKQGDAGGPSLLQARSDRHNHHHNHNRQEHLHLHQHRRLHPAGVGSTSPDIRSPPNEKLHGRQVTVVTTVSVVHHVDATGAVTSVETLNSDPVVAPATLALPAALTAGLGEVREALPSLSLSDLIPGLSDGAPSTTTTESQTSETATSTSSSDSLSGSFETLTPTLFSSSSSAFPTLSGVFNSSSTHTQSLFSNHTVALFSNTTRTTSSSSSSTFASSSTKTKTSSSLWTSTTTSSVGTIAADGAEGSGNAGSGAQGPIPVPPSPTLEPTSGLPPQTRNAVVGGVVGSVAGIAIIALVFLYLLKWRRQRGQGIMLLGDGDSSARKGVFSSSGSGGPNSGAAMTERSGPFAIPSALAKLSGKRAIDAPPSDSPAQEKGFYRVSGKKLISVLESGGDGYSDPHDSIGSGSSSYYRGSQAFLDTSNLGPLQLGSPMRPVSGVPIYRDGPQRTPIHEDTPLSAGGRHSFFPTTLPIPDPAGRSLASRDGSRGSGSRFTEDA